MASATDPSADLEIAVVGLAGRFPGARNVDQFWSNLCDGVESITRNYAGAQAPGPAGDGEVVRATGVLDEVELFDSAFFGLSPREAEITDPQQRIFLECAHEALELAAHRPGACHSSVGVYAGLGKNTYLTQNIYPNLGYEAFGPDFAIEVGNEKDYFATRVSYKLGLEGPSVTVQTACSTSLVAIHLACQGLIGGECDIALAGGSSVRLPQGGYVYRSGGILSPDGHCRAFDSRAAGTVPGNGVGVVVLRRLADAVADRDNILAVIHGSAINNDGSEKLGYTAPSARKQAEVIRAAQAVAGFSPDSIGFVEAHGTGTALGDPIEFRALTEVFGPNRSDRAPCVVGSLKPNVGHLDAAAGVAGFIKAVLALQHRVIPPTIHFAEPNPRLGIDRTPFQINSVARKWNADDTPRRAGVSSFGIGGTNAHVVLQEPPRAEPSEPVCTGRLLTLSARSESELRAARRGLTDHLRRNPDLELADVAYTQHVGRREFPYRWQAVCWDLEHATGTLESPMESVSPVPAQPQGVAFVLPGQGAQYVNMARELYRDVHVFAAVIDRCCEELEKTTGIDLFRVLYPEATPDAGLEARMMSTEYAQPALFVVEYALARLWMHWNVLPKAVLGHSVGEFVGAALAGVFRLEDALMLVARRGRLMQRLPEGGMLAVPLAEEELSPLLPSSGLDLAAVNGPRDCVVSGHREAVDAMRDALRERSIECQLLKTSHAFHSRMMEPIREEFRRIVEGVERLPPEIDFVSTVTGCRASPEEITDPDYWARQIVQPVRFHDAIRELTRTAPPALLQVGPGSMPLRWARAAGDPGDVLCLLSSLPHPRSGVSEMQALLEAMGELWLRGVEPDWRAFHADERPRRVPLPSYPFARQRYWLDAAEPTPPPAPSREESRLRVPEGEPATSASHPTPARVSVPAASGMDRGRGAPPRSASLGPFQATDGGRDPDLGERQRRYVDEWIQGYTARTRRSKERASLTRRTFASSRYSVRFRSQWKEVIYPIVATRFAGAKIWDLDDNEYIDLTMAYGANILGHSPDIVTRAIEEQLPRGYGVGPGSALAPRLTELVSEMTGLPRVDFTNSGTESVMVAVRLARAATGRDEIAVFAGSFHGTSDGLLAQPRSPHAVDAIPIAPGIPAKAVENTIFLDYGNPDSLRVIEERADSLAAVLVEPVQGRSPDLQPREFLQQLRDLTRQRHIALIFDEVLVGFRCANGGAQEVFGIQADLATYGKIVGGGLPIGMVAGIPRFMDAIDGGFWDFGDDSEPTATQTIAVGGTFSKHPLTLVSGIAVLEHLKQAGGAVQELLTHRATRLASSLESLFERENVPVKVLRFASMLHFRERPDFHFYDLLRYHVIERGVYIWEGGTCFLSTAHDDSHVDAILEAFESSVLAMKRGGLIPGGDAAVSPEPAPDEHTSKQGAHSSHVAPPRTAYPRPDLREPFVAPTSHDERTLCEIWQEFLGIERIGINDDYFELGGDSLMSLQVAARARERGILISERQILEHPTVAGLTEIARRVLTAERVQHSVPTGPLPLAPMQSWFFEQQLEEPERYSQVVLLEAGEQLDAGRLSQALAALIEHHDTLRTRFLPPGSAENTGTGWAQQIGLADGLTLLEQVDPPGDTDAEREVERLATRIAGDMDLEAGRLVRAALIAPVRHGGSRLLLAIHHLVVDAVSWRILIEDLQTAYEQLAAGCDVRLPPRTTAFAVFAQKLADVDGTQRFLGEASYWRALPPFSERLPTDFEPGPDANRVASARVVSLSLAAPETQRLMRGCASARVKVNEVLAAAVARALCSWTGTDRIVIEQEGMGRDSRFPDADLVRSVGWFTTLYPVEIRGSGEIGQVLRHAKQRLRSVPAGGLGYGVLRQQRADPEIRRALRAFPAPEVSLLYLGQLDRGFGAGSTFRLKWDSGTLAAGPKEKRTNTFEITALVLEQMLQVEWSYSQDLHEHSTVEMLAERLLAAIRSMLQLLEADPGSVLLASDFPEAELEQGQLDRFVSSLADGDDT